MYEHHLPDALAAVEGIFTARHRGAAMIERGVYMVWCAATVNPTTLEIVKGLMAQAQSQATERFEIDCVGGDNDVGVWIVTSTESVTTLEALIWNLWGEAMDRALTAKDEYDNTTQTNRDR